jgi:superfamily I DNA/RNA helicase
MVAIKANLTSAMLAEVTLSTTHKAKGLEWDNVRLSDDFSELYYEQIDEDMVRTRKLREATRERTKDEKYIHSEEVNLLYVAATRAKLRLQPTNDLRKLLRGVAETTCMS